MSATLNSTATMATITVTATPPPVPAVYVENFFCALSFVDIAIFVNSLLVMSLVGFNRLVAIPVIASFSTSIGNGLIWYAWYATMLYSRPARRVAVIIANIFFGINDTILPVYSFFILEKILTGKRRVAFMAIFLVLWITMCAIKIAGFPVEDGWFTQTLQSDLDHTSLIAGRLHQAYFAVMASLEIVSAYFLLDVFYGAMKSTKTLGAMAGSVNRSLWAQMAHSSEIRVAALAGIGITRLICFRLNTAASSNLTALDRFISAMENCFPMLLLLDLIASKMMKLQADVNSAARGRSQVGNSTGLSGVTANSQSISMSISKEAPISKFEAIEEARRNVDALGDDYRMYIGKGWARGGSISTGPVVPEIPEELDEKKYEIV